MNKQEVLQYYKKEVDGIREAGLLKGEAPFVTPQGSRVRLEDGRELLCMCANNYLGLGNDPRLIEAAKKKFDENCPRYRGRHDSLFLMLRCERRPV